jgi:uncharacterized protein YndB with AHSA1/START domain
VAASPDRIYAAFIDADALMRWLPPDGAKGSIEQFEPRAGGAFRMTLTFEESSSAGKTSKNQDVVNARFVDLVVNERVTWAIQFASDDPSYAGRMTMDWHFAPKGAGTLVTVEARDVPKGIKQADHEQAMASSLDHLAQCVTPGA